MLQGAARDPVTYQKKENRTGISIYVCTIFLFLIHDRSLHINQSFQPYIVKYIQNFKLKIVNKVKNKQIQLTDKITSATMSLTLNQRKNKE